MPRIPSIFLILLGLMTSLSWGQNTLSNGLIAHYPFDGNAHDASGNGNHGTVNGAVLIEDRFGNPNQAYFLDGIDDFIELHPQSDDFKPPLPVSITAWISLSDQEFNNIFRNDYIDGKYHGVALSTSQGYTMAHFGDGGPAGRQFRRSKKGTKLLAIDQWLHLAVVIRGAMDMDIYVNGRQDCGIYSGTGLGLAYSEDNNGRIGVGPSGPIHFFHGKLDDIRFYNRELTKAEIKSLAGRQPETMSICQGASIQLDPGDEHVRFWSGPNLSCSQCQSPYASPNQSSNYWALVENSAGCQDTIFKTITVTHCEVSPCDSLLVIPNDTLIICKGNAIELDAGEGEVLAWSGEHLSCTTCQNPMAMPKVPTVYQAVIIGSENCLDTVYRTIFPFDCQADICDPLSLQANFHHLTDGLTVFVTDASTGSGIDAIKWNFYQDKWLSDLPGSSANFTFPEPGLYEICQEVSSEQSLAGNCRDTFCIQVPIRSSRREHTLTDEVWSAFPTSFDDELIVELPIDLGASFASVFDIRGRMLVDEQQLDGTLLVLQTTTWAEGIYLVRLRAGERIGWKRVVKPY